jgi:hypothetical protein
VFECCVVYFFRVRDSSPLSLRLRMAYGVQQPDAVKSVSDHPKNPVNNMTPIDQTVEAAVLAYFSDRTTL